MSQNCSCLPSVGDDRPLPSEGPSCRRKLFGDRPSCALFGCTCVYAMFGAVAFFYVLCITGSDHLGLVLNFGAALPTWPHDSAWATVPCRTRLLCPLYRPRRHVVMSTPPLRRRKSDAWVVFTSYFPPWTVLEWESTGGRTRNDRGRCGNVWTLTPALAPEPLTAVTVAVAVVVGGLGGLGGGGGQGVGVSVVTTSVVPASVFSKCERDQDGTLLTDLHR